jgi:hypothetical protein
VSYIKYLCRFRSPNGKTHDVIVQLSDIEMIDVLRHRAHGCGAGEPGGPIERNYAWRRAVEKAPEGFEPLYDQDERIVVN